MAAALDELRAKDRFHELEVAYCRGIDRRDPELLRSIFFPDATVVHGYMNEGSAEDWVLWILEDFATKYEMTTHYLLNEWYRVDGDRAEGETHRLSYHRFDNSSRELIAASRTFNRYERRNGQWRIVYREVIRDWIHERPVDKALYEGAFAMEISQPGPHDRSYQALSMFGRGPLQ
ncbi:nuclear transport factor 2 family protein [Georgenia ruanii]|uniref:Nuclear transport factor 2 family protein n=2 Tax=Georgenia ruanii TaxID=348442 RepID=A0A7J9V0F6_9MICO|nr:nuclear transport factor 2 family protein [Georgenia ruanii]